VKLTFEQLKEEGVKEIEYDWQRPLMRLEAGDNAVIKVRHNGLEKSSHRKKYGAIPDGAYKAQVIAPFELECKDYPILSGKYCYWYGNKFGCSGLIYADELGR
jgi:hypothetical protein